MNIVALAENAVKQYETTGTFVSFPEGLDTTDFYVWLCCFEKYPKAFLYYAVEEQKIYSNEFLNKFLSKKDSIHLIGYFLLGNIKFYLDHREDEWKEIYEVLLKRTLEIWVETFRSYKSELIGSIGNANETHRKYFPENAKKIDCLLKVFK